MPRADSQEVARIKQLGVIVDMGRDTNRQSARKPPPRQRAHAPPGAFTPVQGVTEPVSALLMRARARASAATNVSARFPEACARSVSQSAATERVPEPLALRAGMPDLRVFLCARGRAQQGRYRRQLRAARRPGGV